MTYCTHSPCGDASVGPTPSLDEPPSVKKPKLSNSTKQEQFTGAKLLVPGESNDLMSQDEGAIRTKPGRGVRTLSVSCSDKLSRWNILGIQGALLDSLLDKPIYLDSYTFSGEVCKSSVQRAIWGRWSQKNFKSERFQCKERTVNICSDNIHFEYSQTDDKVPSPTSIVWCDVEERPLEVAVAGKRQGVNKTKLKTLSGALRISKAFLFQEFLQVVVSHDGLCEDDIRKRSYRECKKASTAYQEAWKEIREIHFGYWTSKPEDLLGFRLDEKIKEKYK